ncbi:uncharacterized protein [Branchiostoma lanceolatum]|uniref:uncharacterized protein n=1 Tax=Branchiostoma lanceolatum TaxID=7740 RepID=UPI003456A67C
MEEEHCSHSVDVKEFFDEIVKNVSSKWDDLARKLGFDRNAIKGIPITEPSPDQRCREVLERWRNDKGRAATLQVLKQALIDIGERSTAESLEAKQTRKRKEKQSDEEDSSEESSSVGNDLHTGPGTFPGHAYFTPVAKAVASCWAKFVDEQLGFTAQDVVNIQLQHPSSTEQQALQALELWRDRRGRKACRVKLAEALRRGGFQHTAGKRKLGVFSADTFWRGYCDGSLSDTLTRELITDDMRAAEGGADLYIHVRVSDSATGDGDFSDQDPSGTADRGPPHPGPSREHSEQRPPAPGSSNHGDDTPPGHHGDDTGGRQVSGGADVIQVKQEPAEQVSPCCMMGTMKPEIDTFHPEMKGELAGPPKREETGT